MSRLFFLKHQRAIIEYLDQGYSTVLAHILLIGGTHNKQGSKDACVRIVVLLTSNLIKSHKYSGAVLLTALCVKSKILKIIL